MKKAFSLIELIIAVIIVAILASLALPQISRMQEKGRAAEAKTILGALRQAQLSYRYEYANYGTCPNLLNDIPCTTAPTNYACANANFSYQYYCLASGSCFAVRCRSGGKNPNNTSGQNYYIRLYSITGDWYTNNAAYYGYLIQ